MSSSPSSPGRLACGLVVACVALAACAPSASGPRVEAASTRVAPARAGSSHTSGRGRCRVPPVAGRVLDPFRPPPLPWSAGNRGLEYEARPGDPVVAVAAGQVTFAGPVGGRLVVSIAHLDGTRSTYSPLRSIAVPRGARVRRGAVVGEARGLLHLGILRGRTYLDPAAWLGRGCRAVLVPLSSS